MSALVVGCGAVRGVGCAVVCVVVSAVVVFAVVSAAAGAASQVLFGLVPSLAQEDLWAA